MEKQSTMPLLDMGEPNDRANEYRMQRDQAVSNLNSAMATVQYLSAELKAEKKSKEQLIQWYQERTLRSLKTPGLAVIILAVIIALTCAGVEHSLLSAVAGRPIAAVALLALFWICGLAWERASYLWEKLPEVKQAEK